MSAPEVVADRVLNGLGELQRKAQALGQDLGTLLSGALDGVARSTSEQITELEARVMGLAKLPEQIETLRVEVTGLRAQASSQTGAMDSFSARLESIEASIQARENPQLLEQLQETVQLQHQSHNEKAESQALKLEAVSELVAQLRGQLTQFQEDQQILLKRLDAQAEALRDLHLVAQEQAAQKEELRTAVRKLEMIAAATAEIKPLPANL